MLYGLQLKACTALHSMKERNSQRMQTFGSSRIYALLWWEIGSEVEHDIFFIRAAGCICIKDHSGKLRCSCQSAAVGAECWNRTANPIEEIAQTHSSTFHLGWRPGSAWARQENSPISCSIQCFPGKHMKVQLSITIRLHVMSVTCLQA